MVAERTDIAILGGGLAGGLIALALARWRPDLSLRLIERDDRLGGNHVWSFFATDVTADEQALVAPLIEAEWPDYEVRFPGFARVLPTAYRTTTSRRLDAALRAALPSGAILCGAQAACVSRTRIALNDGRAFVARSVIDARGIDNFGTMTGGWQKFLGQRLKLTEPHGLTRPLVMDATVGQIDGYRFVYCLPFAADEIFVEDTYYSDDPAIDRPALTARIAAYAAARGWRVGEVLAEEQGVLPVIAGGRPFGPEPDTSPADRPILAGTRAGLLHPLTSYSLPCALHHAVALARHPAVGTDKFHAQFEQYTINHWNNVRYYRYLAAMLFAAARPDQRYRVMARFYGLNAGLIERFYAGQSTMADKARILIGRPPVPIHRAVGVLTGLGAGPRLLSSRRVRSRDPGGLAG